MKFNPYALLKAAAIGDLNAQRAFADYALDRVANQGDTDPTTVGEGLVFARLAASHGTLDDHGRLILLFTYASMLAQSAEEQAVIDAEALAHLETLADAGVELAAKHLPALAEIASPDAIIGAVQIHELMKIGVEEC